MSGYTTRLIFMDATTITSEAVEALSSADYSAVSEAEATEEGVQTTGLVSLVNSEGLTATFTEEAAASILASDSESETETESAVTWTLVESVTQGSTATLPSTFGGAATLPDNLPELAPIAVVVDKYMLGTPLRKWKSVWAETGVILTSDQRDKHFIQDSDLGLDFVMSLRPVSFKLRVETQGRRHYGFVAQEVAPALKGRSFAGLVESEAGYGVIYSELIAPLVKAVQEQQKQIIDLKAQVQKLLG